MNEFEQKYTQVIRLLDQNRLGALLLRKTSSFAWATCGASSYVNKASSNGDSMLLITPKDRYLITNNIEAPRMEKEEKLHEQGWKFHVKPWQVQINDIKMLIGDQALGSDGPFSEAVDLSEELSRLRAVLTADEVKRFRSLGRLCAAAMDKAARSILPGQTEHQISARLAYEAEKRGVQDIVNLVATDDRIFHFRHPLPTVKKMNRYAMVVLCGRRWGLVCSLTRFVYFGKLPEELKYKSRALAQIDASLISATRPGNKLKYLFQTIIESYDKLGFPDEWKLHHQGGPAGYEPREWLVTPNCEDIVKVNQTYAWNPSIRGAKSEDTLLVGETGNEVLSIIDDWPKLSFEINGDEYMRPAILEIE